MATQKIFIYAINGTGMGHLNRTLVLARAARAFRSDIEIVFAVASPMFWLVDKAGFPVVKVMDRSHAFGSQVCSIDRKKYLDAVFEPMLLSFQPDAFVVDLTIDTRLFKTAKRSGARVAAIVRKPKPQTLLELALDAGSRQVDRFLLPHPVEEFSVKDLPLNLRGRGRQLGPVVKAIQEERVAAMTQKYRQGSRPLVVVAVGGGGYEESRGTVAVVEHAARETPEMDWVIVHGPYLSDQIDQNPQSNVTRLRFEHELIELCVAADVVVCNAGYNTIRELESAGTPAIVIPIRGTGRDDQQERAQLFEQAGRGLVCALDSQQLLRHLHSILHERRVVRQPPRLGVPLADLGREFLATLD